MPLTIDFDASLIQVTSPDTDIDMQVLHDFIEDQMASPEGMLYGEIIQPEGKIEDPVNPGIFSQIIVVLNSPWQIQFWGGSGYTRIYGGKLVGGLSDEPVKATGTAGDITVLESPVDGLVVATGISGLTASESSQLSTIYSNDEMMRKLLNNRQEIIDDGGVFKLRTYDDDDSTVLWESVLTDKDGDPITLVAGAPTERTRGVAP